MLLVGPVWRVGGFWNDETIVTVEVSLDTTDEQVWAAARELAAEYENQLPPAARATSVTGHMGTGRSGT